MVYGSKSGIKKGRRKLQQALYFVAFADTGAQLTAANHCKEQFYISCLNSYHRPTGDFLIVFS
jgi:hypothetical protein